MAMKPKRRRLYFVLSAMTALGVAAGLVLFALEDSLVFFYSPSDVLEKNIDQGRHIRLGGLVEEGSIERDGTTVRFRVTDMAHTISVSYTGVLPDLFSEGRGVVTEGALAADGTFLATGVLAKHDENYMPKEVADALKEAGHWQDGAAER